MKDIVDTAAGLGLTGIAIADHFDPLWPDEDDLNVLDLPIYEKALLEAESMCEGRIRFAKGIEVGFMPGEALDICKKSVRAFPFDFVIGSVHGTATQAIEKPPFIEGRTTKEVIEEYYTLMLESVKNYSDYDVIGHINSVDRYTNGFATPDIDMPFIDEILKIVIANGKGIEINTSSYRYGIGEHGTPTQAILNRYKELGGEIVTIGSDSHGLKGIGAYIDKGEEMLLASGIRYLAVYSERRPEFIKL